MAVLGFLNSKRAILCLALLIAATVLAVTAVFTKDDWISYSKWIFAVWVVGESATKAVEIHTTGKADGGDS